MSHSKCDWEDKYGISEKNHRKKEFWLLTNVSPMSPDHEDWLKLSSGGMSARTLAGLYLLSFLHNLIQSHEGKTFSRTSCNFSHALLKLSDFRKRLPCSRTSVESPEDFSCLRYHLSPPPVLNGDLERDWQWFSFTSRFPLVQKTPLKSRVSHA